MRMIPKVIGFGVEIGQKGRKDEMIRLSVHRYSSIGWNSNWTGEHLGSLRLASCSVIVNPKAVSKNPAFLFEYICEIVRDVVLGKSMGTAVKVFCYLLQVSDNVSVDAEYWEQKLLPFLDTFDANHVVIPWYPPVFPHLRNVELLEVFENGNKAMGDHKLLPLVEGICQLDKVQKLWLDEGLVMKMFNFASLPNLKFMNVTPHVDDRTFFLIVANCPSLKTFREVRIQPPRPEAFFLECKTFPQLRNCTSLGLRYAVFDLNDLTILAEHLNLAFPTLADLTIHVDKGGLSKCFENSSSQLHDAFKLFLVIEEQNVKLVRITFQLYDKIGEFEAWKRGNPWEKIEHCFFERRMKLAFRE
ncbi:hypothetical protein HDU76_004386 [Blyttiomyces sp. JEL0837]|nr:hypothetical protein HDU76_004386 [Blyttiomyces sp. JEL0837]